MYVSTSTKKNTGMARRTENVAVQTDAFVALPISLSGLNVIATEWSELSASRVAWHLYHFMKVRLIICGSMDTSFISS
ncbi:unnamed protein product [Fusarium graminearum]|uniref:Chromosome 2, complete genome n=1 Tax=Gibberella zeae (strain ATCC MYA-4620 / CBS 123657 / FGSC 9075 / NRRL 31084 / PH-1) TaxID=229533 RepID=A0A0E0S6E4_GIBZE|nr:hypothetical protein FG05_30100 [Fusarium graminearum]CAF3511362.1 unnamed protein product [Fusarium graminearum]CEF79069.1 unnamed protein product [Fusarium graminearum]